MVITVGHIWTAAIKTAVTNQWMLTWKQKCLICIWFELLMWQIIRWQTVIKIELSLNPSTRFANSDEGSQRGMLPLKILGAPHPHLSCSFTACVSSGSANSYRCSWECVRPCSRPTGWMTSKDILKYGRRTGSPANWHCTLYSEMFQTTNKLFCEWLSRYRPGHYFSALCWFFWVMWCRIITLWLGWWVSANFCQLPDRAQLFSLMRILAGCHADTLIHRQRMASTVYPRRTAFLLLAACCASFFIFHYIHSEKHRCHYNFYCFLPESTVFRMATDWLTADPAKSWPPTSTVTDNAAGRADSLPRATFFWAETT